MFEKALRAKLRFDSPQGPITTEDLWTLPLTSKSPGRANLDAIAQGLNAQLTASATSFVNPSAGKAARARTQLSFDVVLHVINTLVAEQDSAEKDAQRKATKQRILEIIEQRKDEDLRGKSIAELTDLANSL